MHDGHFAETRDMWNRAADDWLIQVGDHGDSNRRLNSDPVLWHHFTTEFIWFHRPLSDYWKAFQSAGFAVVDFDEPRVTEDRYQLAESERSLSKSKTRPYSVAFKLQKT